MPQTLDVDMCVIGAGSGGLSVAAGASQIGASTVLIEKGKMGGDCLNYGCVPSKALLAAAHTADTIRGSGRFGIEAKVGAVSGKGVHEHVHGVIAAIAPNDSVERFEGFGVNVIQATARFTGPNQVEAGGTLINARRVVVATGSSAMVPPIAGLSDVPFLTNETIFDLRQIPEHLIIIGGGPIGIELAQAHRGLGSRVTVLEKFSALPKDDPELTGVVLDRLRESGVDLREGVEVVAVNQTPSGVSVTTARNGEQTDILGSHILVAAGRRPNVQELDLETAGIAYSPKGIQVDARLRTTNHKVFAIGDVAGGYQFTHVASYHAGIVIKNALFRIPAKQDTRSIPWVTYTEPELAQVGLTAQQAKEKHNHVRVLTWPYHDNDRAQAEGLTEGLVKVVTTHRGHILGAGIVGARAGELIHTWVLAMSQRIKIGAVASMVAPYPTLGEINKRAAGSFYTPKLFSDRTRCIVRLLARLG